MATDQQSDRSVLSALPSPLTRALLIAARPVRLAAGATLFAAGDAGNGCYHVNDGLLKVAKKVAQNEWILALAGPGTILGELSLLSDGPQSASVTAVCDSELSFISRKHFESFANQNPEVYKYILPLLVQRLRDVKTVTADTFPLG